MDKKLDNSITEEAVVARNQGNNHEEEALRKSLKDDEFKSAIAEVNDLRQENARLRMLLEQIQKDYTSLQTRFSNICQPDHKKSVSPTCTTENVAEEDEEESELVSLRLGRSPSHNDQFKKEDKKRHSCQSSDGLKLGLDYNIEVPKSDPMKLHTDPSPDKVLETKTVDARESGPTSEVVKTMRRGDNEVSQPSQSVKRAGDDEVSQPNVKRARVSVRTKCDYPTINDGCQWRKYGQKISRGNPCPRSYYRCSVAPLCPVRKQVQRCVEDMSVLITTYEGTHNHSLPIEATAMASTTSAAASMLLSGSSSTSQSVNKDLRNLANNSKTTPLYLSNSPSNSNPFPTITLDFTTFPTTSSFTSFNFPSNFQSNSGFLSNSLNFSSPEPDTLSKILGSGYVDYDSTTTLPYSKSLTNIGSSNLGRPSPAQKQFDQPILGKNNNSSSNKLKEDSSQQALTETLTKAIASDPSFQSVLAAAISSMVGATKT